MAKSLRQILEAQERIEKQEAVQQAQRPATPQYEDQFAIVELYRKARNNFRKMNAGLDYKFDPAIVFVLVAVTGIPVWLFNCSMNLFRRFRSE